MSCSKEYVDFILEQLSGVEGVTHRRMMGEYILYIHGRIAAYICDDRLMVKPVKPAVDRMPHAAMEPPYEGAKEMLVVDNVDDRAFLKELFEAMYPALPAPKKKGRV